MVAAGNNDCPGLLVLVQLFEGRVKFFDRFTVERIKLLGPVDLNDPDPVGIEQMLPFKEQAKMAMLTSMIQPMLSGWSER